MPVPARWLIIAVLTSACVSSAGYVTDTTKVTISPADQRLDATFELPVLGYVIDHPSGWETAAQSTGLGGASVSLFAGGGRGADGLVDDLGVVFSIEALDTLRGIGFRGSSLDELVAFNVEAFDDGRLGEPTAQTEIEVGGEPAAMVRSTDTFGNHISVVQGFIDEFVYILVLYAPTEETLDSFNPTWLEMLASVRPAD